MKFILKGLIECIRPVFPCQLCGITSQKSHSLCTDCWEQLPWFKQTIIRHEREIHCALYYDFPINRVIQMYKYEQQLHFKNLLSQCLLALRINKIQAIVPMPISTDRLIERGYNQMLVLAQILSNTLQVPVWQPVMRSAQHSQKGLSRVERMHQIDEQFQILKTEKGKYRRVLIIDDVVTTGSSVSALAVALEQLGCKTIHIACIAAPRDQ